MGKPTSHLLDKRHKAPRYAGSGAETQGRAALLGGHCAKEEKEDKAYV